MVKVLFLVLDGVSPRHVDGGAMPTLAGLALEGGWCRDGAIGVMPSSTYPNHATFVTGVPPQDHGIVANELPSAEGVIPSWELGPSVPTLFDAMHAVGRRSAAVFGDHHLIGATGADRATVVWSGDGHADVARDVLGYTKDRETAAATMRAVDDGAELVIAQFNEPDTIAHIFGPDSPEALDRYGRTDGYVGDVVESLRGEWGRWAVLVVSDHSQETVTDPLPVDLHSVAAELGFGGRIVDDGAAAIVAGEMADDPSWMVRVPGVEGVERLGGRAVLAWPGPYRAAISPPARYRFEVSTAAPGLPYRSRWSREVIPAPRDWRPRSSVNPPVHTSWATVMADLLGIPFPPG